MEYLKDYDFELLYDPCKANVIVDTLSRKRIHMLAMMMKELELIEKLQDMNLELNMGAGTIWCSMLKITTEFLDEVRVEQSNDQELQHIIGELGTDKRKDYKMGKDDILRFRERVCVPRSPVLRKILLEEGHKSRLSIHPGMTKMYKDLKATFRWTGMKTDVADYVASCLVCQKAKIEHQRLGGTLEPLNIPQWKWDNISMDFVTHLPRSIRGHDSIWVIVNRLMKCAHFLSINQKMSVDKLEELYVREMVRLHGVPTSIVVARDPRFTSRFWKSLQKVLGTQLRMSSTYHPQTNGQSERTIQSLEDLLRTYVLDHLRNWSDMLLLVEFTFNNTINMVVAMWYGIKGCNSFRVIVIYVYLCIYDYFNY